MRKWLDPENWVLRVGASKTEAGRGRLSMFFRPATTGVLTLKGRVDSYSASYLSMDFGF